MHRHGPSCLQGPVRRGRFRRPVPQSSGHPQPDIRPDLVERIRREIAEGTYETPEKWQAALDRLLERLAED
jgi:hypothetical protein